MVPRDTKHATEVSRLLPVIVVEPVGVSRCLLTEKPRVHLPGSPCETCSGHYDTGADVSEYICFPLVNYYSTSTP
jgi:hypothetical protein